MPVAAHSTPIRTRSCYPSRFALEDLIHCPLSLRFLFVVLSAVHLSPGLCFIRPSLRTTPDFFINTGLCSTLTVVSEASIPRCIPEYIVCDAYTDLDSPSIPCPFSQLFPSWLPRTTQRSVSRRRRLREESRIRPLQLDLARRRRDTAVGFGGCT